MLVDTDTRISRKRKEPDWPRLEPSPEYAPAHRTDSNRLAPTPNWHRRWHHPRARMDAAPPHRLPEPAVTSLIAREARRSPCGSSRVAAEHRSGLRDVGHASGLRRSLAGAPQWQSPRVCCAATSTWSSCATGRAQPSLEAPAPDIPLPFRPR